ncbi:glycosyl transferase, group 1 [Streptomyces griseoflavus Tu4000]|uniref:Glycosyl transferase, group 1 n=1 Tax=Streptomyces griseoflavus Tu4000 TaxID=467200 RepID=D9XM64_9ACTN|nr:glycosyl transferase, group 1 [Streptomyces griseoflavus Tu4000]
MAGVHDAARRRLGGARHLPPGEQAGHRGGGGGRRGADPPLPVARGHRRAGRLSAGVRIGAVAHRPAGPEGGTGRTWSTPATRPTCCSCRPLWMKRRGARFVFDQHDLVPELYLSRFGRGKDLLYRGVCALERMTYRAADVVLATNESYRDVAVRRGGRRPEDVFVVRSAPDTDRFRPVPAEPELKRGKPHLLCYLGVMGPQDGVDYALRALAKLRDEVGRTDWHAVFVGGGDTFDAMVELSRRLGLSEQVQFTGRVPDADLVRYLSSADVCLSPDPRNPLNDVSTMNKVLEYMVMGRPLVSFDLKEARVSAGEAAVYAPADDESEFARLIALLLDDPEKRAQMGKIGQERVNGPLAWRNSQASLLAAYAAACDERPRR